MAKKKSDETYQPKTVIWRETNYEVHLGQVLGVLDFDTNFDDTFQRWKLMIQFITDVMEAIKQEVIPLKEKEKLDLTPDQTAMDRMNSIWHGQTFLRCIKNHEETKILQRELFYDEAPEEIYQLKDATGNVIDTLPAEVIPMPRLKNMIPVGQIDSDNWGIQIRETMALKYAWQGVNYATIIQDGRFTHIFADKSTPKIEAEDMNSLIKRTYIISRPVYNSIMDILPQFFNKNYFIFASNVQKIMKWMKEDDTSLFSGLGIVTGDSEVKSTDRSMEL